MKRLGALALTFALVSAVSFASALATEPKDLHGEPPDSASPVDEHASHSSPDQEAHSGHHGPPPINFTELGKKTEAGDQPPFVFALVNFAVLLVILWFILVPKLRTMIRERSARISKDLDDAARLKGEAEAKLKEYEAKVARLDQDVASLIAEIRAEAEAEKRRLIAAAEASAARAMQDSEKAIAGEMMRIRAHLEREAVTAAIETATKLIQSKITEQDQRALADRFISELSKPGARTGGQA